MNEYALKNMILGIAGRMVQYNALVNNGDNQGYAWVDSPADDDESGEEDIQQPVRKIQWYGFRSRPTPGAEALVVSIRASSSQKALVGCDNYNEGPLDLKDGEAVMFSVGKATIKLDKDGTIHIDVPSGQKVIVNGGSLAVARKTDPVKAAATMATWISSVTSFITGAGGTITAPTDFGIIDGGASAFQG